MRFKDKRDNVQRITELKARLLEVVIPELDGTNEGTARALTAMEQAFAAMMTIGSASREHMRRGAAMVIKGFAQTCEEQADEWEAFNERQKKSNDPA